MPRKKSIHAKPSKETLFPESESEPEPKTKWTFPDAQAEAKVRRANLNMRLAIKAACRDASALRRKLEDLADEVEAEVARRLALEDSFPVDTVRSCWIPRYVPGATLKSLFVELNELSKWIHEAYSGAEELRRTADTDSELGDTDTEQAKIEAAGDTDTKPAAAAATSQSEDKEGPCTKKKKTASSASCKQSTRGSGRAVERERMETDPKAVRESMESSSSSLSEAEWSDKGQEWPRPRDSLAEWADLGDEGGPDDSS